MHLQFLLIEKGTFTAKMGVIRETRGAAKSIAQTVVHGPNLTGVLTPQIRGIKMTGTSLKEGCVMLPIQQPYTWLYSNNPHLHSCERRCAESHWLYTFE